MKKRMLLCLSFAMLGCVARNFGSSEGSDTKGFEQVYALTPSPFVWPNASLLRVLSPDTLSLNIPNLVGSQTLSIAGVRTPRSETPEALEKWRTQSLARYVPGGRMNVFVFARGERGRLIGKILDERGNVSVWLVEKGLALPFLVCRGIDDCSEETLLRLGVQEIAQGCEARFKNEAGAVKDPKASSLHDFTVEELLSLRIQWVGDIRSKEYVPVRYATDIPVCSRVYFQDQDVPAPTENTPQSDRVESGSNEAFFGPSKSNFRLKPEYRLSRSSKL